MKGPVGRSVRIITASSVLGGIVVLLQLLLQEGDLVAIVPFLGAKCPRTTAKSIRLTYS